MRRLLHSRGTDDKCKDTAPLRGTVVAYRNRWLRAGVSQLLRLSRRLPILHAAAVALRSLRWLCLSLVCGFTVNGDWTTGSPSWIPASR
jgi:hypothetical protein